MSGSILSVVPVRECPTGKAGGRTKDRGRSELYRTEVAIMDKRTEYVEKPDYSSAISALQLKRDEAAVKLQGISAAGDDEWEDLKTGTEQVWSEVRTILRDAIMKIK
jgi:hypothetical protein